MVVCHDTKQIWHILFKQEAKTPSDELLHADTELVTIEAEWLFKHEKTMLP